MTAPVPTYLALPQNHADAAILAVFPDGRLAITFGPFGNVAQPQWHPMDAPDYATLFPIPPATLPAYTAPPEGVADQPEKVNGSRWVNPTKWACLRKDGVDAHIHPEHVLDCPCGATRPPRPAGEDAR